MAARTGEVDLPRLGMVAERELACPSLHCEPSCRLGLRDGIALWEKIEERLSGTSRNGRLIALAARLPKPITDAFWLGAFLKGVA
jgi:hypothetical protein